MLKMRLQRIGRKGHAQYRIVVTEHTASSQSGYLELLGSYDPHLKKLAVNKERLNYWMENGAQFSATLNNLLMNEGIIEGEKKLSWKPKKKEISEEKLAESTKTTESAEEDNSEQLEPKSEEKADEENKQQDNNQEDQQNSEKEPENKAEEEPKSE